MKGNITTGNSIVDTVGMMHFTGNIIPDIWYEHIRTKDGKPYLLSIIILSEIVYWYRPTIIRDENTDKKEYEDLRANQIAYIKKKAIEITEIERNALREQYKALKVSLKNDYQITYALKEGFHVFVLIFCIIFLFIQVVGSPIIAGNIKAVSRSIIMACENNWERLITWTTNIYDAVHKSTANETAGLIVGVIIAAIIALVLFTLFFLAIPALISYVAYRYIKSGLFDKAIGWIMIVSGMLCIVLPQWILIDYSWNYLVIWLSVQVVAPIIRYIVIPVILVIIAVSIILGIILIKFFIIDAIREAASPKPMHHMP